MSVHIEFWQLALFMFVFAFMILAACGLGGFLVYKTKFGGDSSLFHLVPRSGDAGVLPEDDPSSVYAQRSINDGIGLDDAELEDGTDADKHIQRIMAQNRRVMENMA